MKDVYIQKNTTEEESKVKSVENLILVSLCSLLYFIFFLKSIFYGISNSIIIKTII